MLRQDYLRRMLVSAVLVDERATAHVCRTPAPKPDEKILARLRKRVERKDPNALFAMALSYRDRRGLSADQVKCIGLLRESADLGFPPAQYRLGCFHYFGELAEMGLGLEQNEEIAHKYYEQAAEGGDVRARHNLGCAEYDSGDYVAAMRHFRLSASGGHKRSMGALIACFEGGLLRHGDLAEALQAFYLARGELESEDRDQYMKRLMKKIFKATGSVDTLVT